MSIDLDVLEGLAKAATPGPWDHMKGRDIIRAIRGDLAVPLFESQEPYCDPLLDAPTCRVGGKVVFRANSEAARQSAAMKQEHRNAAFVAALAPETVLSLIAAARASRALIPAVEAYLMTGDTMAQVGKRRVWNPVLDRARQALKQETQS